MSRSNPLWDRLDQIREFSSKHSLSGLQSRIFEQSSQDYFPDFCQTPDALIWQLLRRNPTYQKVWLESKDSDPYERILFHLTALGIEVEFNEEATAVERANDEPDSEALNKARHQLLDPCNRTVAGVTWHPDLPKLVMPEFIEVLENSPNRPSNLWKDGVLRSKFTFSPNDDDSLSQSFDLDRIMSRDADGSEQSEEQQEVASRLFKEVMKENCKGETRQLDVEAHEMAVVLDFSQPNLTKALEGMISKLKNIKACLNMPDKNLKEADPPGMIEGLKLYDALLKGLEPIDACESAGIFINDPSGAHDTIAKRLSRKGNPMTFIDLIESPTSYFAQLTRKSSGPIFAIGPDDL